MTAGVIMLGFGLAAIVLRRRRRAVAHHVLPQRYRRRGGPQRRKRLVGQRAFAAIPDSYRNRS